jgi:hypothetical protein
MMARLVWCFLALRGCAFAVEIAVIVFARMVRWS